MYGVVFSVSNKIKCIHNSITPHYSNKKKDKRKARNKEIIIPRKFASTAEIVRHGLCSWLGGG
jgi:hypothetical protein